MHDQAVLFTLVASSIDIMAESKRVDILRTVAIGGKATENAVRTYVSWLTCGQQMSWDWMKMHVNSDLVTGHTCNG